MKYRRLTGKDLGAYIKSCKKDIIKRDLSHKIGMTENGLNSALSRESLRLSVFQDICEALGTHPSSFFLLPGQELPEALSLEEPGTEYKFVDQEQIPRVLYNEMKQHLEGEISYLRNQAGHESLDQTIEYTMELMKEGSRHIREKAPRL